VERPEVHRANARRRLGVERGRHVVTGAAQRVVVDHDERLDLFDDLDGRGCCRFRALIRAAVDELRIDLPAEEGMRGIVAHQLPDLRKVRGTFQRAEVDDLDQLIRGLTEL
jgi:hypothetical protein